MMEFSQPHSLTALYCITTPMFLGGAQQQADSEQFRNASFKGALRFWWRALNWGRVLREAGGDTTQALRTLHDQEGALFGLASDGEHSRQSAVQIVSTLRGTSVVRPTQGDQPLRNLAYLLGLGLWSNNDNGPAKHPGVQRDYLQKDGTLQVHFQFRPGQTSPQERQKQMRQVQQSATALGLFGALGSRARKGFGSLALQSIDTADGQQHVIKGVQDIKQFIATLDFSASGDAPLSAFTVATRIDISEKSSDALRVLQAVGNQLHSYRDGTVGQVQQPKNFSNDRVLARSAQEGNAIDKLPERAVFGLPHNYQWKEPGNPKLDIAPATSTRNRRASPLLIHVHAFPDNSVVALQLLLTSTFLPAGTDIELKSSRDKNTRTMPVPDISYQPVHTYLDTYFPSKEVLRRG